MSRIPLRRCKRKLDVAIPQVLQRRHGDPLEPGIAITHVRIVVPDVLTAANADMRYTAAAESLLLPATANGLVEALLGQVPQDVRHGHLGQAALLGVARPVQLDLVDEQVVLGEEQHDGDVRGDEAGGHLVEEALLERVHLSVLLARHAVPYAVHAVVQVWSGWERSRR